MANPSLPRTRASTRQILTLAFAPSAGLGPLRALGGSLSLVLPGAPMLLTAIALTSYLAPVFLVLAGAGAALAAWNAPGADGPPLFALALLLALGTYIVRTIALVRLFRIIMAQPLVAALMRAALTPESPSTDQSDPAGPA